MRFNITVSAATTEGPKDVQVEVDLIWFILLYVEDKTENKFSVILELLKNPTLLQNFRNTIKNAAVKRVLSEYLLFNYKHLNVLKNYIDFAALNVPLDFISYALLIKRNEGLDTPEISMDRINIVNAVLDTGFKIDPTKIDINQLSVIPKVLLMEDVAGKFELAQRLVMAGYKIFGSNPINDAACAVRLIDARNTSPVTQTLIKNNIDQIKSIKIRVAGGNSEVGNLADYYYWVREDMDAVHYLKDELKIELTPSK
jgi:hypothetical protein